MKNIFGKKETWNEHKQAEEVGQNAVMEAIDRVDEAADDLIGKIKATPTLAEAAQRHQAYAPPQDANADYPGKQKQKVAEQPPMPPATQPRERTASEQAAIDTMKATPPHLRPDGYRKMQEEAKVFYENQIDQMVKIRDKLIDDIEKRKTIVSSINLALAEIDGKHGDDEPEPENDPPGPTLSPTAKKEAAKKRGRKPATTAAK